MSEQLQRLLSLPLEDGKLLILTHQNPDPDSIASALALQYLLREKRSLEATVAYSGVIGRAENRAMVELLELPLAHTAGVDLSEYRYLALIDAQPFTGNNILPADRVPDIVIDHHPLREATRRSRFFDVREELGASATILTEYLIAADVAIPSNLATALLYGIRSETQDLGREVSEDDLRAYSHLFHLASPAILSAISRPRLPIRYYQQLAIALDSLRIAGTACICSLSEVIDPDFVSEIADLAVRMEGVEWSLGYGIYDQRVYLSIRTNDEGANAGELMQRVLKDLGRGGGHGMRAGGNIEHVREKRDLEIVEADVIRRFLMETGNAGSALEPLARGAPPVN